MRYQHDGNEVHLVTRENVNPEVTTVATCFNEAWAEVIAGLLQADWDAEVAPEQKAAR